MNLARAWIIIEVYWFFSFIWGSSIYLTLAYIFKTDSKKSYEESLKLDDNVWNDKDTDDFSRYQKFELFDYSYIVAKLICEAIIGF
jgi:hypothetical protein